MLIAGPAKLWKVPLTHGPLAGPPAEVGGKYVFASVSGTIWVADPASGNELAGRDLGFPLATGPVPLGGQLLVGGHDGVLSLVAAP